MRTFYTADTHFDHENIIRYCKRPFCSVDRMNKALVRNWNERVKPSDIVIHAGDFCFRNSPGGKPGEGGLTKAAEWASRLNGHITFIRGNHDTNNGLRTHIQSLSMYIGKQPVGITHRPKDIDLKYDLYFVGHVHDNWKFKKIKTTDHLGGKRTIYVVNVGVDVWDFRPHTWNEIMRGLRKWKWQQNGPTKIPII